MTHLHPTPLPTASVASRLQAQQTADATPPAGPVVLSTSYRTSLVALILRMCSNATYAHVSNFEWYIDKLAELSYISLLLSQDPAAPVTSTSLGTSMRDQLVDVSARVKAIRPYAVRKMAQLLEDEDFLENGEGADVAEVLGAAAWICGEYCQCVLPSSSPCSRLTSLRTRRELQDPRPVIASLFGSNTTSSLPPRILALYLHNGIKIYATWLSSLASHWTEPDLEQIRSVTLALEAQLASCATNEDVELQERAAELRGLLVLVRRGLDVPRPVERAENGFGSTGEEPYDGRGFEESGAKLPPACLGLLAPLFGAHELNPVNPKAQSMVALPEGLDLELVIVPRARRREEQEQEEEVDEFGRTVGRATVVLEGEERKKGKKGVKGKGRRREVVEEDPEELARVRFFSVFLRAVKETDFVARSSRPTDSNDSEKIPTTSAPPHLNLRSKTKMTSTRSPSSSFLSTLRPHPRRVRPRLHREFRRLRRCISMWRGRCRRGWRWPGRRRRWCWWRRRRRRRRSRASRPREW